jgi:hypothetical protein
MEGAAALKFLDRFVNEGSTSVDRPRTSIFGPDGNLYVPWGGTNAVLRYDGATGAFIDAFVPAGSGGLNSPYDLAFGPDGDLYVSSLGNGQVLRFDGSSGAFLNVVASGLSATTGLGITFGSDGSLYIVNQGMNDVLRLNNGTLSAFVTSGSGGLNGPTKAVFGPDGNLYVASQNTNQVLRYNGQTGAFIDSFASTNLGQGNTNLGPTWLEFGPGGYLYTTARTTPNSGNETIIRFNAATGAFVDAFNLKRDGWSFQIGPGNIIYDSANGAGNFVDRIGPSSLAAFTVSLDSASTTPVTVSYSTGSPTDTALAGRDYTPASGTITIPPGLTSQTILIQTLDNGLVDPTKTFTVNLSNPVGGTIARGQGIGSILDGDSTKFYVVDDASTDRTYRYGVTGNVFASSTLTGGDTAPRGAASNAAGTSVWVVDASKNVYKYDTSGNLVGSWPASGLTGATQLTGIATNGTDIWLVDAKMHKVYKYTGAAGRASGSQSAASSFSLSRSDSNPQDIVTDGTSFWVVDGTALKVFKYTLSGALLGSWAIDPANTHPTGITINPNNVSDIWIADNGTGKVFQYTAAAGLTSGSQIAAAIFALAPGDTNPQGIADPPPDLLLTPAAPPAALSQPTVVALSAAPSIGALTGVAVPSLAARDAALALPAREPFPRLEAPAADLLAVATLMPRLDGSTVVADRAGTFGGTSGGPMPLVGVPPLDPANNRGVRTGRSDTSARDGSGGDDGGLASTADFVFAVPPVDAAAGE